MSVIGVTSADGVSLSPIVTRTGGTIPNGGMFSGSLSDQR